MNRFYLSLSIKIYILILILFKVGPVEYPEVDNEVLILPLFFFLSFYLGTLIKPKYKKLQYLRSHQSQNFLILLSCVSIFSGYMKYIESGINFFSLESMIDYRLGLSFKGVEKGSNIFGVVRMLTNGFVFLNLSYSLLDKKRKKIVLSLILYLLSIHLTILGGGRFGIIIHILYVLMLFKSFKISLTTIINKKIVFILSFACFYFLIQVFYLKLQIHSLDLVYAFEKSTLLQIRDIYKENLPNQFLGLISVLHYYGTHSIYEFDLFLKFYKGDLFFGAYQFYPFVMLLNKLFELNLPSIEYILDVLPKAGVYSTGFSSAIVDYGKFLSLFIFFLTGYVYRDSYINLDSSFYSRVLYILISIYLLFLPIISILGASVFPSIIFSLLFIKTCNTLKCFISKN